MFNNVSHHQFLLITHFNCSGILVLLQFSFSPEILLNPCGYFFLNSLFSIFLITTQHTKTKNKGHYILYNNKIKHYK